MCVLNTYENYCDSIIKISKTKCQNSETKQAYEPGRQE